MHHTNSPTRLACVIDDDQMYVKLVKKIVNLKNLTNELLVFNNGKEALDYLLPKAYQSKNQEFPEVILLDLNMPVMNGWKFLQEFTKAKTDRIPKTTLYIVSSSINPMDMEKAKSYTLVSDYLIKPLSLEAFEEVFTRNIA